MPRQSRIDAPGALHHIIVRGIDRAKIFSDDTDRDNFLDRLGTIIQETQTRCPAWALIPNHFHLLLKTGSVPIATVMRRLLTGHAVFYNKRHRRFGHLFQNRYKSILCQEDAYLLELVRYIHLNPLRAKIIKDLKALDNYPYAGHSALMGNVKNRWQDTNWVLKLYDKRKHALMAQGYDLEKVAKRVCSVMDLEASEIWSVGKARRRVTARSLLCYWAVREVGIRMTDLAIRLNLSVSGVSQSVIRGERIAEINGYKLQE